jgi:cytidylate kinase
VEGRDIGTVVFPGAKIKLYLDAALDVRVKRRESDWQTVAVRDVREHVSWRDSMDSTRSSSPLQVAKGAIVIDSTSMTLGEVVDRVSMICADIIGRH